MNRTIMRAYEALDYISTSDGGLTLKEITDKLEIPKSSAFNIVQSLVGLNLVSESPYNQKKYVLGTGTYILGMKYIENLNFIDVCKLYLNPLADELHRNAFVGILDNNKVLYVHKHVGIGAKLATCDVGTRQELYFTGLGKVLLAYSAPDKLNRIISSINFVKKTTNTIDNASDLYTVSSSNQGNKALTYPISLITIDEIHLAGGYYGNIVDNQGYYLYTGNYYWTMSPGYFNGSRTSSLEFVLTSIGSVHEGGYVTSNYGMRPTINLLPDSLKLGSGTMDDPWRIAD